MARNLSFLKSKRFWTLLVAGVAALLAVFFFQQKEQSLVSQSLFPGEITDRVSSFLYLYDAKERTYVPETSEGWKNKDFVRYVFDVAQDLAIEDCIYFIYDVKLGETKVLSTRECNNPVSVSVGEEKVCSSQGEGACLLYVYATASDGTTGRTDIGNYNIDYEAPTVSKVFVKEDQIYPILTKPERELTFMATVADNKAVAGCWLYVNGDVVGSTELSCGDNTACRAQKNYILPTEQERYTLFVQCADHYDPEIGGYVNVGRGELAEVIVLKNHPPDIISCRVTPSQGTTNTQFLFDVEARDPDGEQLSYQWDFGDGVVSKQQTPQHSFPREGTYTPTVIVRDGAGEQQECSAAWVVIQ